VSAGASRAPSYTGRSLRSIPVGPTEPAAVEVFCLPHQMREEIVSHAQTGFPEEVCGIISGRGATAVALFRGRNISATPRVAYELDVETLTRQIEFDDLGLTLAAIYHSHPAGPEIPSETDIRRATYPDSVYLICSLADFARPSLRGFRIVAGAVWEVALDEAIT